MDATELDVIHPSAREVITRVYREESARALATLIRLLGDFDAAEEALQDAFAAAVVQWERDGLPANPRSWLVSAGRNRAIDRMRRDARWVPATDSILAETSASVTIPEIDDNDGAV